MGRPVRDETGRRYGRLTVVRQGPSSTDGVMWHARCDCGQDKLVLVKLLRNGHTRSCGCLHRELLSDRRTKPISEGTRFGRLVVLLRGPNSPSKHSRYYVRCDCGKETLVTRDCLRSGHTQSCGCLHRERVVSSLTKPTPEGVRFGKLTVLQRGPSSGRRPRTMWLVRCDCGTEKLVSRENLIGGNTKSCGCSLRKATAAQTIVRCSYKGGAKQRGLSYSLSEEEFLTLTSSPCHYCGRLPFRIQKANGRRRGGDSPGGAYTYNGIDRMDNSVGYEFSNCVPCCTECNRAKMDRTYEEFIEWINRMHSRLSEDAGNRSTPDLHPIGSPRA